MNIKGYWDLSKMGHYDDEQMWVGRILIEDDGWFEGLVQNRNNSHNTGTSFVFGFTKEGKIVNLYKVSNGQEPTIYKYYGDGLSGPRDNKIELLHENKFVSFGKCEMSLKEISLEKEPTALIELDDSMSTKKDAILGDYIEFYNGMLARRHDLIDAASLKAEEYNKTIK